MEPEVTQKGVKSGISLALDLDASGINLEAFHWYLSSVWSICAFLNTGIGSASDRRKMIARARQCLDRIQHIADLIGDKKSEHEEEAILARRLHQPHGLPVDAGQDSEPGWSTYRAASLCEPPAAAGSDGSYPAEPSIEDNGLVRSPRDGAVGPDEYSRGDNSLAPAAGPPDELVPSAPESDDNDVFDAVEVAHRRIPIPRPVDELDSWEDLSPLDAARRDNERLVTSYTLRMQRSPPHMQHNLGLELHRRLIENRHIATMKHQAWLKRREEARQHHLEIARRVFSLPDGGTPTPEDLQKQATFADILQFEQTHLWTQQLRRSLDQTPDSERAVENALLHMFLEKSHPLSKLRQRLQYSLFCKINPLVEQHAHLLDAVRVPAWSAVESAGAAPARPDRDEPGPVQPPAADDAQRPVARADEPAAASAPVDSDSEEHRQQTEAFRRHLRNVVSDTQDSVQLLVSLSEAVHPALAGPLTRPVVQRLLFTPLWPHLLVLFRLANRQQERLLAAALCRLRAAGERSPDAAGRRLLRRLLLAASPADKCRLLVELVRLLCNSPDGPAGADLLLPRLTALVVDAGAPQLLSELHFISEFMSDGSFQGEQGYCLTSLQTVLLYLVQQQG